jgi:TonB family protein
MKTRGLLSIILYFSFYSATLAHSNSLPGNLLSSDSVSHDHSDDPYLDPNNKGISLVKEEKYEEQNKFLSEEIKKNESDRNAYFNRGIVRWHLNDAANACRDWSSVLALGDTAAFKLLDKNCHGSMIVDEDTIPSTQYHKMWSVEKKDNKTLSASTGAITLADEMPEFPGGTDALLDYFEKNLKYPVAAREHKIQGRVYVNFILSRKGKVLFPYVTRGIGSGCNEEAIRVIRAMPQWKPGKQKGKPALVRYNLPVNFSLK